MVRLVFKDWPWVTKECKNTMYHRHGHSWECPLEYVPLKCSRKEGFSQEVVKSMNVKSAMYVGVGGLTSQE